MQAYRSGLHGSPRSSTEIDLPAASTGLLKGFHRTYSEYWATSLCRGLLALLFGTAILIIPALASVIFLVPFAIVLSVVCLAAYGFIDSALVFATSFMVPHHRAGRIALSLQGALGAVLAVVLFSMAYERVDVHWFLYIAAAQAGQTAVAELIVARGTSAENGAHWCYGSAAVAGCSCVALLLGKNAAPPMIAWLLYGYLGAFGFNLFALSARMLFAERQILHRVEHAVAV